MSEPIIEQIAEWIANALDGVQDPDATLTLRSIRPTILDWEEIHCIHGDVIILLASVETQNTDLGSFREEKATFILRGTVTELPGETKADTVLSRMSETIRKTLLAANADAKPANGLMLSIDCPAVLYQEIDGGVEAVITCEVDYSTNIYNGYSQD